jgi:hypothetical protein
MGAVLTREGSCPGIVDLLFVVPTRFQVLFHEFSIEISILDCIWLILLSHFGHDLTKQAMAYHQMSLLLCRPPGLEALLLMLRSWESFAIGSMCLLHSSLHCESRCHVSTSVFLAIFLFSWTAACQTHTI